MKNLTLLLVPILLGMVVVGCGGGGGGGGGGVVPPATPVAPSGLTYTAAVATYVVGEPIVVNAPSLAEGAADSYGVTPALPAGLTLDPVTGTISGTPTVEIGSTVYTVTAFNPSGSTTTTLTFSVIVVSANALGYDTPVIYSVGIEIPANVPADATAPSTYTIDPALPSGLLLNGATGVITGTPLAASPATTYEVTEDGATGIVVGELNIAIAVEAPSNLVYPTPVSLFRGIAMDPLIPTVEGSPTESFSIDPMLPMGLVLDSVTGIISGVPDDTAPTTDYLVTASNDGGSTTFTIQLTVELPMACDLSYASPIRYAPGLEIVPNEPTSSCTLDSYEVTPALPAGLELDPDTGIISGTPDVITAAAIYTVDALGSAGFGATAEVEISIGCGLLYDSPVAYVPDVLITPNEPTSDCIFDTFTIDPALPAGLALDESTGAITGTPTADTETATYTISATGVDVTDSFDLELTVGTVYEYAVEDTAATYVPATGVGSFSVNVSIEENPNNVGFPHDIAGFQMGLSHDPAILEALDVLQGTDLTAVNAGDGADFFLPAIYSDGFTIGVVVSLTLDDALLADGPQIVCAIDYQTVPSGLLDNDTGLVTDLIWSDTLGDPVITNLVSVDDEAGAFGLVSKAAVQLDGEVTLSPE